MKSLARLVVGGGDGDGGGGNKKQGGEEQRVGHPQANQTRRGEEERGNAAAIYRRDGVEDIGGAGSSTHDSSIDMGSR